MKIGNKIENVEEIYLKINDLLKIDNPVNNYKFIGNHPISLTKDNIILLLKKDYMVCEKSDGVRIIFIVLDKEIYFYDRLNEIYKIGQMDIPNCMFDGELFYDDKGNIKYGIFDCLAYNKEVVCDKNLLRRLYFCELFIKEVDKCVFLGSLSIEVYLKKMYKSYGFLEIYNQIKLLDHKNDGLIFTPVEDKYILYKRGTHLKWKPPCINTIDFRLVKMKHIKGTTSKEEEASNYILYELKCTYRNNEIVFDYFYSKSQVDNKIGEFIYDRDIVVLDVENCISKKGGWILHKIRDDKDTPNHYRVVNNILESLDDNLDIEELSRYYKPMRNNYKLRESRGTA